jgi:hypothetical protein
MVLAFEGRRIEEGEAIGGAVFGVRGYWANVCSWTSNAECNLTRLHGFANVYVNVDLLYYITSSCNI